MSVGIDAIDDDHQKILSIISEIIEAIEAIDNDHTVSIIEGLFDDLERSTSLHFKREEELMLAANYAGFEQHKEGHQAFLAQLPQFKEQLVSKNSDEPAEEISQRLYDWVINHVIASDMDFAQEKHSIPPLAAKKSRPSLFARTSHWFSYRITLSMRVFFIAVLPIVGMLILSFIILKDNYLQYKNMQLLSESIHTAAQVNSLTHSLQIERGLSLGYVSSNYQQFDQELVERRKVTDAEIQDFSVHLNRQTDLSGAQPNWLRFVQKTKNDITRLTKYRSEVERQSIDDMDHMFFSYTQQIGRLLSGGNNLVHIEMDSQFTNDITAINTLLSFKEIMGQERALGTMLRGEGKTDSQKLRDMNILLGRQLDALHVFNYSASEQQKAICGSLCNEATHKASSSLIFAKLISLRKSSQARQQWFMSMTAKMDNFKLIADQIINDLDVKTNQKLTDIRLKYHVILTILSSIILLNILLFSLLNHSVITPIRHITHALTQIALGRKTRQIYSRFADDEIGSMYKAYEKLRRKLVEADLSKNVIHFQRKSLRHRKQESDRYKELASKDALTGAINRREFNKTIDQEILYARQGNHALSTMSLDIDHFKIINDTYGHGIGDIALINFYKTCCENVRASDAVARIGGEEFVILMPGMGLQQAAILAERVRKTVSEQKFLIDNQAITFTVSIGVAQWDANQFNGADEFLSFTDKALYEAKHRGRNCVVVKTQDGFKAQKALS